MKQHRILADLTGKLPEIPAGLRDQLVVKQVGNTVQIETPGELSEVLKWLASAPLADVYVQPVGLRAIYDQFHHESTIVSQTEVNA